MPNDMHDTKETAVEEQQAAYKLALTQTIGDDEFNEGGLLQLAETIGDDETQHQPSIKEIQSILLDTLNDTALDKKFVDFYPADDVDAFDRLMTTEDQAWANEFDTFSENDSDNALDSFIPGRYKVNGFIGSDHNGHIFSAQDNNLERNIAVKFLKAEYLDDFEQTQRFIDEAKHAAAIQHPGSQSIHDIDFTDGALPYYTMRKSLSLTLGELIERAPHAYINSHLQKVEILVRVCECIEAAHKQGLIHGDIKPNHIIVHPYNDIMVKGWQSHHSADSNATKTSQIKGTPMYMSPEQACNGTCTTHSDIYCLGSTMLHLLTLRLPLFHKQAHVFWELKQQGEYDDFTHIEQQNIPQPLVSIVHKCLNKDPNKRYQNVQQLRNALIQFSRGQSTPDPSQAVLVWTISLSLCLFIILFAINLLPVAEEAETEEQWSTLVHEDFNHIKTEELLNNGWAITHTSTNKRHQSKTGDDTEISWHVENGYLRPQSFTDNQQLYNNITQHLMLSDVFELDIKFLGYREAPQLHILCNARDRLSGYAVVTQSDRSIQLTKNGADKILASAILDQPLSANRTYHMRVKRAGDFISVTLNDERILEARDLVPLNGPEFQYVGFESKHIATHIQDFKVTNLEADKKLPALNIPDHLYNQGEFVEALQWYNQLGKDHASDSDIAPFAIFRSGLCLHALDRNKEAVIRFQTFLNFNKNHELAKRAQEIIETIHSAPTQNSGNAQ